MLQYYLQAHSKGVV